MKTQKKYQTPQVTICQLETSTLMACSNEIGYDPDITTDGTARSNRNFWDNGLCPAGSPFISCHIKSAFLVGASLFVQYSIPLPEYTSLFNAAFSIL